MTPKSEPPTPQMPKKKHTCLYLIDPCVMRLLRSLRRGRLSLAAVLLLWGFCGICLGSRWTRNVGHDPNGAFSWQASNQTNYFLNGEKVHLIHVVSPYVDNNGTTFSQNPYYPLDVGQWAAMASIHRALLHVPRDVMTVEVVCAVFSWDYERLKAYPILPCHRYTLLKRSTRTEYPHIQPIRDLPFLSDIIQGAIHGNNNNTILSNSASNGKFNFYYNLSSFHVLHSNADIGLSKHFYSYLYDLLHHHDALSINRVTIPPPSTTVESINDKFHQYTAITTSPSLRINAFLEQYIDPYMAKGLSHPGYDLFCMHSSILDRVSFGDFFLGRPPWGGNIHLALEIMADNYINIPSNPRGSFHLGNDSTRWKQLNHTTTSTNAVAQRHVHSSKPRSILKQHMIIRHFCPYRPQRVYDDLGLQNEINCGAWFVGSNTNPNSLLFQQLPTPPEHHHSNLLTTTTNNTSDPNLYSLPAFVNSNHAAIYWARYASFLQYSKEDGIPSIRHTGPPNKNAKAKGMFAGWRKRWKQQQ